MSFFSECVKPHLKVAVIYCSPLFVFAFLSLLVPLSSIDAAYVAGRWFFTFLLLWGGVGLFILPVWRFYVALGQGLLRSRMLKAVFALVGWFLNFWVVGFLLVSLLELLRAGHYRDRLKSLSMDSGADAWTSYLNLTEVLLVMSGSVVLYGVLGPAFVGWLGRFRRVRAVTPDNP